MHRIATRPAPLTATVRAQSLVSRRRVARPDPGERNLELVVVDAQLALAAYPHVTAVHELGRAGDRLGDGASELGAGIAEGGAGGEEEEEQGAGHGLEPHPKRPWVLDVVTVGVRAPHEQ